MASKLNRDNLTLALCIALFPPVWAVLAPHIGIQTGAVALICAGVYVANGNKEQDALPMSLGFLAGDVWAVLALGIMEALPFNPEAELFCTLFVLGGLAVVLSSLCPGGCTVRRGCAAGQSGLRLWLPSDSRQSARFPCKSARPCWRASGMWAYSWNGFTGSSPPRSDGNITENRPGASGTVAAKAVKGKQRRNNGQF